jgi:hypothetical protein
MPSRRDRIYASSPSPVSGYELNPVKGLFSVIIPEATTNLISNPSVEGAVTTGYAAVGGATVAAVSTWQAYGTYGLSITPVAATESGTIYPIDLSSGITYTFSAVIQGEEGKIYYAWFADNTGALLGTKRKWIGTGHKQRVWVTYTEVANANRRVAITRDAAYNDTHVFYTDGWQVEAKSYPTTYCDGDQVGFLLNDSAYLWNGTPHSSTSTRSSQTRSGGREMNLLDLGFRVLAVMGLGLSGLVDQFLPIPGMGELPQGTGTSSRTFVLAGSIEAVGPRHLQAIRAGLIDAFKPDLVSRDQPLLLRYQPYDEDEEVFGESLDIVAGYMGGLEGQWDNHHQEKIGLTFKMYIPLLRNTYSSGVSLGYQTALANANYIVRRNSSGVWSSFSLFTNLIDCMVEGLDGSVYVGGAFSNVGDPNGDRIVKIAPDGTISSLGTGMQGGTGVFALAVAPNGDIVAGGDFTTAGGVADTVRIARWNGTVWLPYSTGISNGTVYDLKFDAAGVLYVGGAFTDVGDAAGDAIVSWTGAAWVSLGSGLGASTVYAIACHLDGSVYLGGTFTDHLLKWNGVGYAQIESDALYLLNGTVWALEIAPNGDLYAGGEFTTVSRITVNRILKWNGFSTQALQGGVTPGAVYALEIDNNNNLLLGGSFTTANGIVLPDGMAAWNGSNFAPIGINLPGAAIIYSILTTKAGDIYISFSTAGTAYTSSVPIPPVALGSASTYPVIRFVGPGTLYELTNFTTGKSIYFNLTLLAGETAILNLDPLHISFISSFRGNILNSILPGSNLDFPLLPGSNNVSAYMFGGTTAATAITMAWVGQYWSIDAAAWK